MSKITDNESVWVTAAGAGHMQLGPGPQPNPASDEVVIKVNYAAVNPTDWKVSERFEDEVEKFSALTSPQFQETPYWEVQYPIVLGTDVAGTIVQLGEGVTRFKVGQRVIGYAPKRL